MITFEQALTASMFHDKTANNRDGTPLRWRRNGKTKTWKTRPEEFQVPVKHGLYEYGYVTHRNAAEFVVA